MFFSRDNESKFLNLENVLFPGAGVGGGFGQNIDGYNGTDPIGPCPLNAGSKIERH